MASTLDATSISHQTDDSENETANDQLNNAKYELKYVDTEEGKGYDLL